MSGNDDTTDGGKDKGNVQQGPGPKNPADRVKSIKSSLKSDMIKSADDSYKQKLRDLMKKRADALQVMENIDAEIVELEEGFKKQVDSINKNF